MTPHPKSIQFTMLPAEAGGWAGDSHPTFRAHRLLVGGQDISSAVRELDLHAGAGVLPTVTLDLVVIESEISTEAAIEIPEKTRDALIALGWTPPAAE